MVRVSVVLPALNERENLRLLVPEILSLEGVEEVVLVDDASEDGTEAEFSSYADRRLRYWRNSRRLGLAVSTLQGIRMARAPRVIVRDSDLNHDPAAIPLLQREAEGGATLVIASRYSRGERPVGRSNDLFSILLSRSLRFCFGAVSDWTFGYYLLRKTDLASLDLGMIFRGRGEYTIRLYRALLGLPGTRVREVPTAVRARGAGRSTTRVVRHGLAYLAALTERIFPPEERSRRLEEASARWRRAGAGLAGAGHSFLGARARMALMSNAELRTPVLDLACGNGAFTRKLLPEGGDIDGVDQFEENLDLARTQGYRFTHVGRLPNLPRATGKYPTILLCEAAQYLFWDELERLFAGMAEATAANGRAYVLFPLRNSLLLRLRKGFGGGRVDFLALHDASLVAAAATAQGWSLLGAWGGAYGSARVKALDWPIPSPWHTYALLELRAPGKAVDGSGPTV